MLRAIVWFVETDLLAYLCYFNLPFNVFVSIWKQSEYRFTFEFDARGLTPVYVSISLRNTHPLSFFPLFFLFLSWFLFLCFCIYVSSSYLLWCSRLWRPWVFQERWKLYKDCVQWGLLRVRWVQRLLLFLGALRDFLNWMLVDLNYEGIFGIYVARVIDERICFLGFVSRKEAWGHLCTRKFLTERLQQRRVVSRFHSSVRSWFHLHWMIERKMILHPNLLFWANSPVESIWWFS